MSRDDLIWLAGLLEGEGSFDLHRGRYPRVRLAMTDRDVVGRAATLLGGSVRLSLKPAPHRAMWHVEVSGAKASAAMRAILPFMGARRSARIADVLGHATLEPGTSGAPGPAICRPPAM
ncbi:LAGLIDADG family homing endonuclease [Nocardioides ochotonae]|uniref:LAGLIDADG family homing endonuclease n=1 Tax=Nocardioides ochotonae TaxID=2685869 RepID=UPI00174B1368|nr:LAGLIDADG family homing endonuclease [Nocardioides ochotonae]